jgi:hypothetical protein
VRNLQVGLSQGSKQVQLPDSGIKPGGLELLDEVAVNVFVPAHHCADNLTGGRELITRGNFAEVRM